MSGPRVAALIVAAGRGIRVGGDSRVPKQYLLLGGEPVVAHVMRAFAEHDRFAAIQVAIHEDERTHDEVVRRTCPGPLLPPIPGGATRQETVAAGLAALASTHPDWVLIHDAARPLVSREVIDRV